MVPGETAIISGFSDLELSTKLLEMGFLPGHKITPARSAPGGDPRVFRVDGCEIALRRETAMRLILR